MIQPGMNRKIFKTGHSLAVTLSQSLLKELDLKLGDEVNVEIDKAKQEIVITHGHKASQLALGLKLRPHLRGKT